MKINTFILFLTLLFSCTDSKKFAQELKITDLNGAEIRKNLSLESHFSSVEMIPLESTEDPYLRRIDKVVIVDSLLIVLDSYDRQAIYVFSKTGKYKYQIGKRDFNQRSFAYPHDILIDSDNSTLFVLDNQNSRILSYNIFSGKLLDFFPIDFSAIRFAKSEDSNWWFAGGNQGAFLKTTNSRFKVKEQLLNRPPGWRKMLLQTFILSDSGSLYFPIEHNDTIFNLNESSVMPWRLIKYRQEGTISKPYLSRFYFESPDASLFLYRKGDDERFVFTDKRISKSYEYPALNSTKLSYLNYNIPDFFQMDKDGTLWARIDAGLFMTHCNSFLDFASEQ